MGSFIASKGLAPIHLPTRYSELSWEDRRMVRRRYEKLQGGCCAHCGEFLAGDPSPEQFEHRINWELFPENFQDHPVHLHHDHLTDMTIGAVHMLCNAVLFQVFGE